MRKLILLVFLVLLPVLVLAGTISLTTTISSDILTIDDGQLHIKLLNSGDEAAYNVQLSIISDSFESGVFNIGILEPNRPFEDDLNFSLKTSINAGNYPLVLLTEYTDANGYPFSSVSPITVTYKSGSVSFVSGNIPEIALTGNSQKKLYLNIRNADEESHNVKVKVILSKELKIKENEKTISIKSKEEKKIGFEVSNFGALEGSNYVVLASLEYDKDGLHYSSFARGMIGIGEEEVKPSFSFWIPLIALGILFIVFLVIYLRGK